MDEICSIPSCHRIEDIKDCTICKPSAYFCGDCFDNHECAVYSKSNPCPENFRCGFKTCYKEFYTPCTNCKPNTYWCQDCFTKHKCSTTDSDEGEAEDENDDCDKSSDYSTYNCSICNLSWTYVSGTDPGSCDNCAENNLSTESTIKYNNSSVTENYFVAESTNNYDNSSSTQGR